MPLRMPFGSSLWNAKCTTVAGSAIEAIESSPPPLTDSCAPVPPGPMCTRTSSAPFAPAYVSNSSCRKNSSSFNHLSISENNTDSFKCLLRAMQVPQHLLISCPAFSTCELPRSKPTTVIVACNSKCLTHGGARYRNQKYIRKFSSKTENIRNRFYAPYDKNTPPCFSSLLHRKSNNPSPLARDNCRKPKQRQN